VCGLHNHVAELSWQTLSNANVYATRNFSSGQSEQALAGMVVSFMHTLQLLARVRVHRFEHASRTVRKISTVEFPALEAFLIQCVFTNPFENFVEIVKNLRFVDFSSHARDVTGMCQKHIHDDSNTVIEEVLITYFCIVENTDEFFRNPRHKLSFARSTVWLVLDGFQFLIQTLL
jgi:hypothetical protein